MSPVVLDSQSDFTPARIFCDLLIDISKKKPLKFTDFRGPYRSNVERE
jgi:hypothetical protein